MRGIEWALGELERVRRDIESCEMVGSVRLAEWSEAIKRVEEALSLPRDPVAPSESDGDAL